MLLLATATGCSDASDESQTQDGSQSNSAPTSDPNGTAKLNFEWPTRANPLLLQLEIATSDSQGTIEIELMPELAPENVDQLVRLARDGQYDGTTFHRVIRGFMIQGGDPNTRDQDPMNDGAGGLISHLPDEFSAAPFQRGVVALANHGRKNSNSSQFFILQEDNPDLDGRYTAVGRVTQGIELVDAIANSPTDKVGRWGPKDRPIERVTIRTARIVGQNPLESVARSEPAPPQPAPALASNPPQSPDPARRQNPAPITTIP